MKHNNNAWIIIKKNLVICNNDSKDYKRLDDKILRSYLYENKNKIVFYSNE